MNLLNRIIQLWKNKKKIFFGFYNLIFKSKSVEDVAAARMKICNDCIFQDKEGSTCLVPGTQPCCKVCGCSLAAATRSLSYECPKGYWKAVMTEEEETKQNHKLGL
jgi:hypothetical protein